MPETNRNSKSKAKNSPIINFAKWEWLIIVGLIILIIFSPIIFTQISLGPSFIGTGEIGDTIGGITAPFVNLLAAFLVYKSFTAQIAANKQQRDDHNEQMNQINREHTFNYLSNLFKLAKDYYYSNNYVSSSKINLITSIYNNAKSTRNDIKYDLENFTLGQDFSLSDHDMKKAYSNRFIVAQLIKVKSNLTNILEFLKELNSSILEDSIKKFYYREIELMLNDMQIWRLTEEKYFKTLDNYDIVSLRTQKLIDECVTITNEIYHSKVKLSRISEYLDI
jgi:glycosyltransferase involved in cell wall biosynthesis